MLKTVNLGLQYGSRVLFKDVNITFTKGNCYGIIGANGAGKSTFLKLLSGEIESTSGEVILDKNERMSILRQDQNAFNNETVLNTVLLGHKRLIEIMKEKDELYAKEDFTDEDGVRAAELEGEFAELGGWDAESDAETLLNGIGVPSEYHYMLMGELDAKLKIKVLLAQALFGNPDILLLDEPTNNLDYKSPRRYSQAEIEQVAQDTDHVTLYGKLEDKFGDNGVVSVVIGKIAGEQMDELHLELWIMSCRVLKRDMEFAMMDELVRQAKSRGIRKLVGYYDPTAKNAMVRDVYSLQGFTKISEDQEGNTVWEYVIPETYENKQHVIAVNEKE